MSGSPWPLPGRKTRKQETFIERKTEAKSIVKKRRELPRSHATLVWVLTGHCEKRWPSFLLPQHQWHEIINTLLSWRQSVKKNPSFRNNEQVLHGQWVGVPSSSFVTGENRARNTSFVSQYSCIQLDSHWFLFCLQSLHFSSVQQSFRHTKDAWQTSVLSERSPPQRVGEPLFPLQKETRNKKYGPRNDGRNRKLGEARKASTSEPWPNRTSGEGTHGFVFLGFTHAEDATVRTVVEMTLLLAVHLLRPRQSVSVNESKGWTGHLVLRWACSLRSVCVVQLPLSRYTRSSAKENFAYLRF